MVTATEPKRRRQFTQENKLKLVKLAIETDNVYLTAKNNQIALPQLFRWKKELKHLLSVTDSNQSGPSTL